jgi:hypothetical protein
VNTGIAFGSGILLVGLGVVIVLDLGSFGTRAVRFSLYLGAAPWRRDPEPDHDAVEWHRAVFGSGVALLGLAVVGLAASGLW